MNFEMGYFSERLKKLREARKLSQRAVALGVGISPAQISRYESGERTPTEEVIRRVAIFFGVSADYLLGLTDDPSPKSGQLPDYLKEKLKRCEELEEKVKKIKEILDR